MKHFGMKKEFQVNKSDYRLDRYLQEELNISRMQVKRWLKSGYIRINSHLKRPSYIVQKDDVVTVEVVDAIQTPLNKQSYKIDYLYEDSHIVVLNKPAGMLVHPAEKQVEFTLVDYLKEDNIKVYNNCSERPGIVHRLDKMTEGIMVVAKSQESYHHLVNQFKSRDVQKFYYAMVKGNVINDTIEVDQPIGRDPKHGNQFKYILRAYSSDSPSLLDSFISRT